MAKKPIPNKIIINVYYTIRNNKIIIDEESIEEEFYQKLKKIQRKYR